MKTLRVPVKSLRAGSTHLDREASHYLTRVHRRGVGSAFIAFDPERALVSEARVLSIDSEGAFCEFATPVPGGKLRRASLTLIQGIGKSDKPDRIVRDATALGVHRLIFVETERSVVRLLDRAEAKRARLHAIAVEAARQSGRSDLPQIEVAKDLESVLGAPPALDEGAALGLVLVPALELSLMEALERLRVEAGPPPFAMRLLIGPEGGLSEAEIGRARASGYWPCSLPFHVLRTETAALAALAVAYAWFETDR